MIRQCWPSQHQEAAGAGSCLFGEVICLEGHMMRSKMTLMIETCVLEEAHNLGLNMSRVAEEAIAHANKLERNWRWNEENRKAMEARNAYVEKHGIPLSEYRPHPCTLT
jgi:antitoxin CcdA